MYKNKKGIFYVFALRVNVPQVSSRLSTCPAFDGFCLPAVEDLFLGIALVFWGGSLIVNTIFAPSVVLVAWATRLDLAALAAFAANLFLFRYSTGVALGGSKKSPGITLGMPDLLPLLNSQFLKCFWRRAGGRLTSTQVSLIINDKPTFYQVINLAFLQFSNRQGNSWCHLHICVQGLRCRVDHN